MHWTCYSTNSRHFEDLPEASCYRLMAKVILPAWGRQSLAQGFKRIILPYNGNATHSKRRRWGFSCNIHSGRYRRKTVETGARYDIPSEKRAGSLLSHHVAVSDEWHQHFVSAGPRLARAGSLELFVIYIYIFIWIFRYLRSRTCAVVWHRDI